MKTVLITGASTGIGLALSKLLLGSEYRLILTARAESLHRFATEGISESERVWIRPLDITVDMERRAIISEATRHWGGVDILVNNAGIAFRSVVEHVNEKERFAQMNINFLSPMELTRLVLPHMRHQKDGHIINISSVGGMMAMPTMSVYSASKFALEGATEALWYEVQPWNIKVSLIRPGFVHSDSFQNTRETFQSHHSFEDEYDPYHSHYLNMSSFIEKWMRRSTATPEAIATIIFKTMKKTSPPLRVNATVDSGLFMMLRRFLPRQLYHRILYLGLPKIREWGKVSQVKRREEDAADTSSSSTLKSGKREEASKLVSTQ